MRNIALILLLTVTAAFAGEQKLAWDASLTEGVTNYVLTVKQGTNTARVSVGTNLTATVDCPAGVYSIFCTAQKDGVESDPSNTLVFEVPSTPSLMRTIVVEASMNLTGTNWLNAGFFRLRLTP